MLGLQADAPNGRLYVDPQLPAWLTDVTLLGVTVGQDRLDLRFWREKDRTRWQIIQQAGSIRVEEQPWLPWRVEVPRL